MSVTKEQIDQWKQEYGSIYKITITGTDFIYKTLNRDDYMNISLSQATNPASFDHEFETVKRCLLSTHDTDDLKRKSGIATIIYADIMSKSGFQEVEAEEL